MSSFFDRAVFALTPVRWPTVPRRAFLFLLLLGVVYLVVGWVVLAAVAATIAVAVAVFWSLMMAIGVPVFWCWQQVSRLWSGAAQ